MSLFSCQRGVFKTLCFPSSRLIRALYTYGLRGLGVVPVRGSDRCCYVSDYWAYTLFGTDPPPEIWRDASKTPYGDPKIKMGITSEILLSANKKIQPFFMQPHFLAILPLIIPT